MQGTVIFFSAQRGYGFIKPDDNGADVFVHFSDIVMEGYRELIKDQVVEFELGLFEKNGETKTKATNVRVKDEDKSQPISDNE